MSEYIDMMTWQEKLNSLSIVVIIPTYNNDKTLLSVIEGVKRYSKHIIVINDGSTDTTAQILATTTDIQTITHPVNKGKGYALKTGLLAAKKLGFRYAITIDSDGQHYPSDIPAFVDEIEKLPDTMLVGARNLTADNMPGKNTFANKFSNFWFRLETGIKLNDTQSGYRLYPLHRIGEMKYCTAKYEFELEMIVFLAWKGVDVKNIPVNVYYPPEGERVSHFRPLRDFTRISILNTILVIITFLWILPMKFFKKLTWTNIRAFIDKEILKSKDTNKTIILSIMLGVFMGIVPIWGYQMIVTVFLAHFLKLNKVISLVASNISIPPMMPFLLYGSYATGCFLTNSPVTFDFIDVSLDSMKTVLFQYLTGSIIFALLCSIIVGIISGCLLLIFRKERQAIDI
ncbi:DUF2062 domain-containing protein [Dysgonomonas sp. Marseille-P4677]|uniref:DUF2062 domain-containing protein n=1 Tax=Dysgonomonas sp. Marseille-P4677 TaxID=2364790 RepID=UPI001911E0B4|nr:DUF2062 domain-containing protein [Dysgonomonas sp. Marseille-P4677]MBK5720104.1 DUF2062 domain-containing protein [Dysgonomonas sp. Marseille-P4677]